MSNLPTYRHSEFEAFAACPFAYAAGLHHRAEESLSLYLCDDGAQWVRENCEYAYPIPAESYVTELGTRFHQFAYAYGAHLQRENRPSDWSTAKHIAEGLAGHDKDLLGCMTLWYQAWEYDLPEETGGIPLVAGGFETGQRIKVDAYGREGVYGWHPDYARLSKDLKTISVYDWKSGLSQARFDPRYPPDQLVRYAWAFTRLYPTIRTARLELWHVNPHNPLSEHPLRWEVDLTDPSQYEGLVLDPITAIAHMPEFPTMPGCWLCTFCDWSHCCPSTAAMHKMLNQAPEDARLALTLHDHSQSLSDMLTAKRKQLKAQVNAWVDKHGPLDLGDGRSYGPQSKPTMKVKSMQAFLQEAQARGRDVSWALSVTSAKRHDLAAYIGADDPFSDDDQAPWESVKLGIDVANEIITPEPEPEPQDDDAEFAVAEFE